MEDRVKLFLQLLTAKRKAETPLDGFVLTDSTFGVLGIRAGVLLPDGSADLFCAMKLSCN